MSVSFAILESAAANRIVRVADTPENRRALRRACDDFTEAFGAIEYCGRDDDGDTWRVHIEVVGNKGDY